MQSYSYKSVVFWVMTPCSDVVGDQHFRGPCCLHLQGLENRDNMGLRKVGILPHHYSVVTQKTRTGIFIAVKT
jgi:hypothetical protein